MSAIEADMEQDELLIYYSDFSIIDTQERD